MFMRMERKKEREEGDWLIIFGRVSISGETLAEFVSVSLKICDRIPVHSSFNVRRRACSLSYRYGYFLALC